MSMYCGIDLHSTKSWVTILDDQLKVVREKGLGNNLEDITRLLEPYRDEIEGIAVESTWNWYWLVDGLMEAGYRLHLTNTWAAQQWDGLKYTDDRHDARWLAHLLKLGILPEGYIYPKEERPVARSFETAGVFGAKEDVFSTVHAWFIRVSNRYADELQCIEEMDGGGRRKVRGRLCGRSRDHISAGTRECIDRPNQYGRERGAEPRQTERRVCSAADRLG